MKQYFIFLFLFFSIQLQGQQFLNGFVVDTLYSTLPWPGYITLYGDSIFIENTDYPQLEEDSIWIQPIFYTAISDNTGAFHLLVEKDQEMNIRVEMYQQKVTEIRLDSVPSTPIYIKMKEDPTFRKNTKPIKNENWFNSSPFTFSMGMDYHGKKYDAFEDLIGPLNNKYLGTASLLLTAEFGKVFNRIYTGFEAGTNLQTVVEDSGQNIEANSHLFALHIGYELIKTRISYVMPKISFKRYSTRIINSPDVDDVPFQTYLQSPDLDLRFIQPIADIGVTIGYNYRGKDWIDDSFGIIGMSAGYAVPLRDEPKIRGLRSAISTDKSIDNGRLTLSFFFRFYFSPSINLR